MKVIGVALVIAVSALWAQQAVVLDFSASMAGFAGAHQTQTTGMLQRLGNTLLGSGQVQFLGLSAPSHHSTLVPLSLNDAAVRFARPRSFGGYSPLRWALSESMRHYKASDIVMFTDGMEDDARLEDVANSLAEYAKSGWSMGVAALILPFDGIYYTEMKMPFADFRSKIEEAIRVSNPRATVRPAKCTDYSTATCFFYTGPRPLLVLLFSKSGSLDRLFTALEEAAKQ